MAHFTMERQGVPEPIDFEVLPTNETRILLKGMNVRVKHQPFETNRERWERDNAFLRSLGFDPLTERVETD